MKILVLEDSMLIAMMLVDEITDAGHTVLGPVRSVSQAIRLAEDERPDLALLNITLRGGERGTDAAVILAQRWDVPCLFVSGSRNVADQFKAVSLGIVEKPYDPATFRIAIDAVEQMMAEKPLTAAPPGLTLYHRSLPSRPR